MNRIPLPTEEELKHRFALALSKGDAPWIAVCKAIPDALVQLYPEELCDRLTRAELWPLDPYVLQVIQSPEAQPSKEALQDLLWMRIQDCEDGETLAKLTKEYRELRGWTAAKAPVTVNAPGVMIVPSHANDEEWEKDAVEQQRGLTNAAH